MYSVAHDLLAVQYSYSIRESRLLEAENLIGDSCTTLGDDVLSDCMCV